MDREALKKQACVIIDDMSDALISASHAIHAKPELAFEEHFAHGLLTDRVEEAGLPVERGACGLDTAFISSFGDTGVEVGILSEYDALPVSDMRADTISSPPAALARHWRFQSWARPCPAVCAIWAHRPRKPAAAKRLWRNMVLLTGSMRQ